MMFAAASSRLPVEVISLVFDWVDIAQLLLLSRVCSKWRAVARSHPLFWRDVRLEAVSSTALDFFEARLAQTTNSSINLIIGLPDIPLTGQPQSVILPAIARNLRRARRIGLLLHSEVALDLMRILTGPAPCLEHVGLLFYHLPETRSSVPLPSGLFAGTCPSLRGAALTCVSFPEQRIRAFEHVDSLLFNFGSPRNFDLGLFSHFPALTSLTVCGESCLGTDRDSHQDISTPLLELTELEVHIARCDYDSIFHSIRNLAQIPVIKCRRPRKRTTRLFITHLEGEIEMNFISARRGLVHILLYSPSSGRSRTLIEFAAHFLEDWPRDVLFDPAFVKRVTTLRIYSQLAYLTPHFEELPACRTLEVIIDDTEFPPTLRSPPSELRLPMLKKLVVVCAGSPSAPPRMVPASALSAFLALLVGQREKRPLLELEGISVSGDRETLQSAFDLA